MLAEIPAFPNEQVPARACLLQSTERTRCYAWLSAADGDLYIEKWSSDESGWTKEAVRLPHSSVGALELLIAGAAHVRAADPEIINPSSYSIEDAQRLIAELETIVRDAMKIGGIKLALDLIVNFVSRFLVDAQVHEDQMIGAIRKSVALLSSMTKN